MKVLATIVSILFHPLLLTTYLVLMMGIYFPTFLMISQEKLRVILAFIFCFTFLLPAVNLIIFKYFGTISSLTMRTRRDRIVPFIAISIIYLVTSFLFYFKLPLTENFNKLILIVTLLVVTATILTFFAKVSIHSLAVWGGIGILLPLNKAMEHSALLWPTTAVVVVAGLVMSARLYLNAHTPQEIWQGSIAGFLVGFAAMIILF